MQKHNPPAFPRPCSQQYDGEHPQEAAAQNGMTLRDYFAAQALNGELACQSEVDETTWADFQLHLLADRCWRIADAMLDARSTSQQKEIG